MELFANSRAPWGIDALALFSFGVLPFLMASYYLVRARRAYAAHKWLQSVLAFVMIVALLAFEWEVRRNGWRLYAMDSVYYETWVTPALILHLAFACPTFGLWVILMFGAWKKFPRPTRPSEYSMIHKRLGRITVWTTLGTSVSGWLFYWLAFLS